MSWSDAELAEIYRRSVEERGAASPCPDPGLFERTLLGTASAEERLTVAAHLEECASCASFLQELRGLSGWAERAAQVGQRSTTSRFLRPTWLPALAACLLLVIGGGWLWTRLAFAPPASEVEVLRGRQQVVVPPSNAHLTTQPRQFDWPDEAGAVSYRLELFDDRAGLVWRSSAQQISQCALPEEIVSSLAAGRSYSWRVTVDGPVQRSRLGPFWFSIVPGE